MHPCVYIVRVLYFIQILTKAGKNASAFVSENALSIKKLIFVMLKNDLSFQYFILYYRGIRRSLKHNTFPCHFYHNIYSRKSNLLFISANHLHTQSDISWYCPASKIIRGGIQWKKSTTVRPCPYGKKQI